MPHKTDMDRLEFIEKAIECCLVSCNRKASLLQADILKFANSLKQIFLDKLFANNFFQLLPPANNFLSFFGPPPPPVNIKWFLPKSLSKK